MKIKYLSFGDFVLYALIISIFCFDGDASLNKIMYLFFAMFLLVIGIRIVKGPIPAFFFKALLPFVAFCLLSVVWSVNRDASLSKSITVVINYVIFSLLWVYIQENNKEEKLIKAIAIAGGIFALYIIFKYGGVNSFIHLMGAEDERSRIGSEVAHESLIGQSLALAGITDSYLIISEKKKHRKIIFSLIYLFDGIVILASQSRTGLAILVMGTVLLVLFSISRQGVKRWIPRLLIIAVVLVVVLINIDFSPVLGRWTTLVGREKDASTVIRYSLVSEGLSRFVESPLWGFGIDASSSISRYHSYFHNNYVELLATTGIIGFTAFYSIYLYAMRGLTKRKSRHKLSDLSRALLIAQLVIMLATVTYYIKYQYLFLVLITSVAWKNRSVGEMENTNEG